MAPKFLRLRTARRFGCGAAWTCGTAQGVDAMYAHVGDGATSSYGAVVKPCASMARPGIRELRPRKDRPPDVTRGDVFPKSRRAFCKTKDLGNAEKNAGVARRFDHPSAFFRIHAHRFLAQHRLAGSNRGEHVLQVAGIRSGNQHSVDFGTAAKFFGGGENMRDRVLCRGLACLVRVSARQSDHFAVPSPRETRHQPPHGVQSETCDTKANHIAFTGFSERLRVRIKDEK